jgi:hypothetical protein
MESTTVVLFTPTSNFYNYYSISFFGNVSHLAKVIVLGHKYNV